MSAKHTPGPWQVVPASKAEHRWVVGDSEGGSVASCEPMGPWMSSDEADANARLIAAAPEMFKALTEAVDIIENHTMFDAAPLHALLAKARIPDIQIKGAA